MIQINRNTLKAVSRFSATKDVRYYLNGVYVQASPSETRLSATNGHILAVHTTAHDGENVNGGFTDLIIPADTVSAILKIKPASKYLETVTLSQDNGTWKAEFAGMSVAFIPIDGKFPDYTRVIPRELSGVVGQYQPELLSRCQDALGDLNGKKADRFIEVKHNGTGAAIVDMGMDNMIVIIMPFRVQNDTPVDTAWAFVPVAVPADAPVDTGETVAA